MPIRFKAAGAKRPPSTRKPPGDGEPSVQRNQQGGCRMKKLLALALVAGLVFGAIGAAEAKKKKKKKKKI